MIKIKDTAYFSIDDILETLQEMKDIAEDIGTNKDAIDRIACVFMADGLCVQYGITYEEAIDVLKSEVNQ